MALYTSPDADTETSGEERIFGALLKNILRKKEMSQRELARKLGIEQSIISNYIKGFSWPEPGNVHKLCDALEVDGDMRMRLLDAAGKGARAKLEYKEYWREGFASIAGGGSLFGALLYHLRQEENWSMATLAKKAGLTRTQIFEYESGKRQPEPAAVHKLCDALGTSKSRRMLMLDAAGKGAWAKFEENEHATDKKYWRNAFTSIAGGGSLFGALLYHLRNEKHWSRTELGKKAGLLGASVSRYENGTSFPEDAAIIHRLCDALDVEDSTRELMLEAAAHHKKSAARG